MPAQTLPDDLIRVATLKKLSEERIMVVHGSGIPIAVFANDGRPVAIDNRCPHMGFPMHRGSVKDGIVTCHWHEARFDLASGCTFDLFADDLPVYQTEVRDGVVYVAMKPKSSSTEEHCRRRMLYGMQQNISLIQGKAIIGLLNAGVDATGILREVANYATGHQGGLSDGLITLTAVANLIDDLDQETAYFSLFKGVGQVAANCAGSPPRRPRQQLDTDVHSLDTLRRWMRHWTQVRHRDGAERTLLTAIVNGADLEDLNDLVFSAVTDRPYANQGHLLDLNNKAFELLDVIGREHAAQVLPLMLDQLISGRGGEENSSWHHPIDLITPLREAEQSLPSLIEEGRGKKWEGGALLSEVLLGEDPIAIINALSDAFAGGAAPAELTKRICHAAAMRLARFALTNDVRDWFNPVHSFTYCNAMHQTVARCRSPLVLRGIYHGAIAVYLDRFLNVPAAKLPGERQSLDLTPVEGPDLLRALLDSLDQRHEVDAAATIVARYLRLDHPIKPLINTLVLAAVREDVDFHAIQAIEDGVQQYRCWQDAAGNEGEQILIGVTRYVASRCPTPRAGLQTATIAQRLQRGDKIYDEESAS